MCPPESSWSIYQVHLSPRSLGLCEHYDDLEDLTSEKRNDNLRLRREAVWKVGSLYMLLYSRLDWLI